jgi:hypothetical protein
MAGLEKLGDAELDAKLGELHRQRSAYSREHGDHLPSARFEPLRMVREHLRAQSDAMLDGVAAMAGYGPVDIDALRNAYRDRMLADDDRFWDHLFQRVVTLTRAGTPTEEEYERVTAGFMERIRPLAAEVDRREHEQERAAAAAEVDAAQERLQLLEQVGREREHAEAAAAGLRPPAAA